MIRYVDHIAATFGTGAGQKPGYCGHPEIELALVKLYRVTGEQSTSTSPPISSTSAARSRTTSTSRRGRAATIPASTGFKTYEYSQSHKPVREQDKVVGHAVRAMYLYAAMADLAAETGDEVAAGRVRAAMGPMSRRSGCT